METATQKKNHLNSTGQDKCARRVGEKILSFPSNKNTTKKISSYKGLKHTYTHTHKRNRLLGFFFFFLSLHFRYP